MQLVRIQITDDDALLGEPRNGLYCAACIAIRRALPGAHVAVSSGTYSVNGRPYKSPPALREYVHRIDEVGLLADAVRPASCEFELWVEDGIPVADGALVAGEWEQDDHEGEEAA